MQVKLILATMILATSLGAPSLALAQITSMSTSPQPLSHSPITLETLAPLIGKWTNKENPASPLVISFEMIANNTVMVETWATHGKTRSLTLYHQDGTDLMATHYCPQGNQPRLKMTTDSQKGDLKFVFEDSTNLETLDDNHQHSLGLKLPTPTSDFIRTESYLSGKGEDFSALVLVPVT